DLPTEPRRYQPLHPHQGSTPSVPQPAFRDRKVPDKQSPSPWVLQPPPHVTVLPVFWQPTLPPPPDTRHTFRRPRRFHTLHRPALCAARVLLHEQRFH